LAYDKADLIENIRQREELCPTTVLPGLALPHPRHSLPYDIAESFIIVGRTASGVPFGDPSGVLTRLFFLICCKDERTHLHVLARLSRMLDEKSLDELMDVADSDELRKLLRKREEKALG
jgi:PTS system nitrogen regulatory IIA component